MTIFFITLKKFIKTWQAIKVYWIEKVNKNKEIQSLLNGQQWCLMLQWLSDKNVEKSKQKQEKNQNEKEIKDTH